MEHRDRLNLLEFAVEIAHHAGRLTLGYFLRGVTADRKSDDSPVTIADRQAEQFLRERIAAQFPDHGIVGEEFGETRGSAGIRWILDPIDGTFSFIHGVPLYSVLIGVEAGDEIVAGVVHIPALAETIWAARGDGCRWNGRRARVSETASVADAVVLTGGGRGFARNGRSAEFERLIRAFGDHRSWCDAYGYALVATGRADAIVDPKMSIWDVAALLPCIEEAGGRVTDWAGGRSHRIDTAVATNGRIHDEVLALLRG
ncbi:MAG: histidinol-phosphatase [Phycisphaerales bacterium]|nr:histidinol-phosphatase [Phycisphaerales bacterium]